MASSLIEQTLLDEAHGKNLDLMVTKVPISDGGEGFLECIQMALKEAKLLPIKVCAPVPGLPDRQASYLVDF